MMMLGQRQSDPLASLKIKSCPFCSENLFLQSSLRTVSLNKGLALYLLKLHSHEMGKEMKTLS